MCASDEIESLREEAETLAAAQLLSSAGKTPIVLSFGPDAAKNSQAAIHQEHHTAKSTDNAVSAETRRERKALAAKAARKRARERLASLESEARALREWVAAMRSQVATYGTCGAAVTSDQVENDSHLGSLRESPPMVPPKKRRIGIDAMALVVDPVD